MPGDQLLVEGRSWLRRVGSFQGQRLTLNQHREILTLAGRHNSSAGPGQPGPGSMLICRARATMSPRSWSLMAILS